MNGERDRTEFVTRGEMVQSLETWGGALLDRMDRIAERLEAKIESTRIEMKAELKTMRAEINEDIGRAVSASAEHLRVELTEVIVQTNKATVEQLRTEMHAIMDPHRDIPPRVEKLEELTHRVEKLEDAVFKPAPKSKPKRRARG